MPDVDAEEAAPGVRAATHVPRTWRAYLAVRPEVAALFALVVVIAALGVAAHRSLYFQVSEVSAFAGFATCMHAFLSLGMKR